MPGFKGHAWVRYLHFGNSRHARSKAEAHSPVLSSHCKRGRCEDSGVLFCFEATKRRSVGVKQVQFAETSNGPKQQGPH